jgi:hypothetical protein
MFMRNTLALLFIIFSSKGFSQIDKNQWLIGGNASFSYSQSKELKISEWQISPAAGYFFMDKFAGGLRLSYGSQTRTWSSEKDRNVSVSFGPFLRYYFLPKEQKVNLFADVEYQFSRVKDKNIVSAYPSSYSYSYYEMSLMAGPAFFINEHTSLEFTFGYSYLSRGQIDTTVTNRLKMGIGLQIHLGNR